MKTFKIISTINFVVVAILIIFAFKFVPTILINYRKITNEGLLPFLLELTILIIGGIIIGSMISSNDKKKGTKALVANANLLQIIFFILFVAISFLLDYIYNDITGLSTIILESHCHFYDSYCQSEEWLFIFLSFLMAILITYNIRVRKTIIH